MGRTRRSLTGALGRALPARVKRRLYAGGRPGALMRAWNRLDAALYSRGVAVPGRAAVLQITGRRSGRVRQVPVAIADLDGAAYLVSMLGTDAGWVHDVQAAQGRAALRHRRRTVQVRLAQVPTAERAPVLRRYLEVAPGARPHLAVRPGAPLSAFEQIADNHPVFRIDPLQPDRA